MNEPIHTHYADARDAIRDADLLLFADGIASTRLIAVAGRSQYVHAAIAGWWNDRLMCVEMTSGGGLAAQLLSNIVERRPGVVDVYRANAARRRFSRRRALLAMIGITGKRYGWANLCLRRPAASARVPLPGPARHERPGDLDLAAVLFAGGGDGRSGRRRRSVPELGRSSDRAGRFGPLGVL